MTLLTSKAQYYLSVLVKCENIPTVVFPSYKIVIHCKISTETVFPSKVFENHVFLFQLHPNFFVEVSLD